MVPETPGKRMSLRARIIEAAGWTLGAHGAELGIRLVSNLIMTRLLFPEAFGLMAVVITIPVGLALMTDAGIQAAIIRSKNGEDREFLRTAWTLQAIRGSAIWLIVLAVAGLLSVAGEHGWLPERSTLADPLLPALLVVVGGSAVFQGLESVNLHSSARRIDFKRLVLIGIASRLVSFPVMLLWVWHDRSVWALVAGLMASSLCQLVLSHIIIPGPRMGFRWHGGHVRELFHFGKWITVSSAGSFISSHSDRLILGALFPGSVLGFYAIARLLIDSFDGIIQRLHGSLTLPVFAEVLRHKPETLRAKYYEFRRPIEAAAFLSGGALLIAGPEIVETLYDDRYSEAGWMLQVLALAIIGSPFQIVGSAFIATGEARRVAAISWLHAAALVVGLLGGYQIGGLAGAVWGVALSKLPGTIFIVVLARRRGWIKTWPELRSIPLIIVGGIIGAILVRLLSYL